MTDDDHSENYTFNIEPSENDIGIDPGADTFGPDVNIDWDAEHTPQLNDFSNLFTHPKRQARWALLRETQFIRGVGALPLRAAIPPPIIQRLDTVINEYHLAETNNDDDRFDADTETIQAAADEFSNRIADYYQQPRHRFERIVRMLDSLGSYDGFGIADVFYEYAQTVTPDEVDTETTDRLARRLQQAVSDGDETDRAPLVARAVTTDDADSNNDVAPHPSDREADPGEFFNCYESNGMLFLDEIGLEWWHEWTHGNAFSLDSAKGKACRRWEQQQNTPELLTLWAPSDADIPTTLQPIREVTEYLWDDEFREDWERYHNNAPSLPVDNFDKTEQVALRPNRQVEQNGNQLELIEGDEAAETVAQTALPSLPEKRIRTIIDNVDSGTDALRSMTGVRLLVYAIREGFEQAFRTNLRNPNRLEFEGGFKALADAIGEGSNKGSRTKLRDILKAGQTWRMDWPGGEAGGLWTYTYESAEGKNERAFLRITLGDPLMPQYTQRLKGSSRILVPIVELMPPVSSRRFYADQAIFQLAFVRGMVERRKHILEDGGAHIPEAEAWQIAKRIGLDSQTVMNKALDRWCRDGDDAPAFLEEVEDNHYLLADNGRYGKARRFLLEQAKRSKSASLRGKQGGRPSANSDD